MLSSERGTEASCILEFDRWRVVEMQLTPEKLKWLWEEMNRYRTLFSDLTRGDVENFYDLITSPNSLWLEIYENGYLPGGNNSDINPYWGKMIGIAYWTGMQNLMDADAHLIFFDRKPAEKADLCREIIRWFFDRNPEIHRMSATLPHIYHATIRLAKKIGFRIEGRKRQSQLMGGRRVDEVMLGLLASEV